MKICVTMKLEKETPGTYRYKAVDPLSAQVPLVYVKKLPGMAPPASIILTITGLEA